MAVDPAGPLPLTRAQARSSRWERSSAGCFLPAGLDPEQATEQRIVAAAFVVLGVGSVTGWAALRWRGARYLDEPVVDLVVPRTGFRRRPGMRFSAERVTDDDVEVVDGLPVVTAACAAAFAARHADSLDAAVDVLDRACAADLVSIEELAAYAEHRLVGATGVGRLRQALVLAVENSWSPMETEMRLLWRRAGLVDPLCNVPVFDRDGHHLGTPDLLDPIRGVVGEYDGLAHLERDRRDRDITREGRLRRVGLEYVEMTAPDRRDPRDFLRRTHDAVGRVDRARWTWSLEPPSWWRRTETVAQRRALSPHDRRRLLGWQR